MLSIVEWETARAEILKELEEPIFGGLYAAAFERARPLVDTGESVVQHRVLLGSRLKTRKGLLSISDQRIVDFSARTKQLSFDIL